MHAEFATRRRYLVRAYQRYQLADKAWTDAVRDLRDWFPEFNRPGRWAIGNPGSRMRRLYEQRERARMHLEAAHLKLKAERQRLVLRRETVQSVSMLSVPYFSN